MKEQRHTGAKRILLILFRILFTFFAVGTTVFIFANSLEIGAESAARSHEIMELINSYVTKLGLEPLSEFMVRKLAHFSEYALLAFWFTLCLRVYTRHYFRHISWPLFLTLLIANTDETIQTFVADRAGSVRDVWIDFAGGCAGICAGLALIVFLSGFWYMLGFGRKKK